ncbi:MAG: divalent-cation tolerance protein CutA [Candidatus Marinimicrobia bacterium]|nr:divalent-cation tolerance protein CutA [Candidatus Neomarinimicrobiota bacterium]MBL7023027.1 divalent-cation tolerance protein CutA [Candidatus Neomarinimicrobiota bacterium]
MKIILTSIDSNEEAKRIARLLVENKLSPCVQILNNCQSIYSWDNKIVEESEYIMIIKCKEDLLKEVCRIVLKEHNYDTPELIEIDTLILNPKFLKWFNENSQ